MGDVADYDRADRPSTAQPPPRHVPGGRSVHDLITEEIGVHGLQAGPNAEHHPRYRPLRLLTRLLRERRRFGLRKYGTILQVDDPQRDPTQDFLEECADALCYAYRMKAQGIAGGAEMFEAMLTITAAAAVRWYWPDVSASARPDFRGLTLAQLDDLRAQEVA